MLRRSLVSGPIPPTRALALAHRGLRTTAAVADPAPTSSGEAPQQTSSASSGFLGSLLYGSEAARAEGDVKSEQHSKLVGRGKYVHEKITHAVTPSHRDAYLEAAEAYFNTLVKDSPELGGVKLTGSWETIIGSVGNFTHILEYEGHGGYDRTRRAALKHKTLQEQLNKMLPHLQSRQHQMVSEFSFWPSSPPHDSGYPDGGIFEMRTYQLQPGKLLEWEAAWRRGLEARKRFVQPVGAFFAQIGQLHEVHHIWQYPDLETRKKTREQTWTVSTWADTVQETVKLTKTMENCMMVPCKWSPLR